MDIKELDKDVREFVNDVGYSRIKRCGLGATIAAFYTGMNLVENSGDDFYEIAAELGLSRKEVNYWEDLYWKKDSWLNKGENK